MLFRCGHVARFVRKTNFCASATSARMERLSMGIAPLTETRNVPACRPNARVSRGCQRKRPSPRGCVSPGHLACFDPRTWASRRGRALPCRRSAGDPPIRLAPKVSCSTVPANCGIPLPVPRLNPRKDMDGPSSASPAARRGPVGSAPPIGAFAGRIALKQRTCALDSAAPSKRCGRQVSERAAPSVAPPRAAVSAIPAARQQRLRSWRRPRSPTGCRTERSCR